MVKPMIGGKTIFLLQSRLLLLLAIQLNPQSEKLLGFEYRVVLSKNLKSVRARRNCLP